MLEGSREQAVPHSLGLRDNIKEETFATLGGRILRTQRRKKEEQTNVNEIGENSGIIRAESKHGLYIHIPHDKCGTFERMS